MEGTEEKTVELEKKTHYCLYVGHQVVKVDESKFGLQMGVLAQMASCMAIGSLDWAREMKEGNMPVLRSETFLYTEHISETG